jgi:hypothetical protein
MAKFPVEQSDLEGQADAINNLLSGPSGLGQNFAGVSESVTGYLTGNYRIPFTATVPQVVNVAPIALSTAVMQGTTAVKFTFAAAQPTPPFAPGNAVEIVGVTNSFYDGVYRIGVAECTTTYVILRFRTPQANPGASSGGSASLSLAGGDVSTDGDARVTVNSATDRVFVSAQLTNTITYKSTSVSQLFYTVKVNRYKAFPTGDAANPDYLFDLDKTIAYRLYNYATLEPTETAVSGAAPLSLAGLKAVSTVTYPVTYTPVVTTVTGSGINLTVSITLFPTGATPYTAVNTVVTVENGGSGYAVGDTVKVLGTALGGATPANDLTMTVTNVNTGTVTLATVDTVFTNIIDVPTSGYYRYILEVEFVTAIGGDAAITQCELGYRSLACQVVKE